MQKIRAEFPELRRTPYLGIDVLTILHSDPRVRIDTFERNPQGSKRFIYLLLQLGLENRGRSRYYIADFEHAHLFLESMQMVTGPSLRRSTFM